MDFGSQQSAALTRIGRWINGGTTTQQVFRFFGYAGTGKTTLAKHVVEAIDGDVYFAAYTGKAALVLRKKGCPSARTIHSLIYNPAGSGKTNSATIKEELVKLRNLLANEGISAEVISTNPKVKDLTEQLRIAEQNDGRPRFKIRPDSPLSSAKLLVLDEASMVDEQIGKDLMSFGCPILVLGDPAQLPPVRGTGFFTDAEADFMLTEVHRQAADSPILALATRARSKLPIPLGDYGHCKVVSKAWLRSNNHVVLDGEQVLCGRNATRSAGNRRFRELLGRSDSPSPVLEDRLVCLRNDPDFDLLNGSLWTVNRVNCASPDYCDLGLVSRDEPRTHESILIDNQLFLTGEGLPFYDVGCSRFDFSYFMTVHKAQGSQFESGVLFDESQAFKQDAWRHFYTGITRYSDTIIIAKD